MKGGISHGPSDPTPSLLTLSPGLPALCSPGLTTLGLIVRQVGGKFLPLQHTLDSYLFLLESGGPGCLTISGEVVTGFQEL